MNDLWTAYDALAEEAVRLRMSLEDVERKRQELRLRLGASGRARPDGGRETSTASVLTEIVDAVRNLGGTAKASQIATALSIDVTLARTRLRRAAVEKMLQRLERGTYSLSGE